jgi:type II secretory pathway pseudopilin PulG
MTDLTRINRDERGISLVEMMVATVISAVVGSLLIAAMGMVTRVDRFTRQDSEALAELRTATERFQKEMRQARKVYDIDNPPASTATIVHFWVDYNRDNQQNADEKLIWRLETASLGEMRLVRTNEEKEAAAEDPFVEAVGLVTGSSFAYNPAPPDTTIVTLTLRADINSVDQPSGRTVRTQVRLRNATA